MSTMICRNAKIQTSNSYVLKNLSPYGRYVPTIGGIEFLENILIGHSDQKLIN